MGKPNSLIHEKSPYLLQHAENPVEWYPWGDEALDRAKKENKPIFLSIGYSTCHWCHVMAHESFENPEIAAIMNKHFINIKVDREERPDVDALYMTTVQMITGSGGWPMSVWLTPNLKPFYGGTYFPPEDRYGRPGFPALLTQLAEVWEKDNKRAIESSDEITTHLTTVLKRSSPVSADLPNAGAMQKALFDALKSNFDSVEGGFGRAPKFLMPVYLDALIHFYRRTAEKEALAMVGFTVKKILKGGIYDQLAGGFARYSTDEKWTVPHFEKMLYDNAQMIRSCSNLYGLTQDPFLRERIQQTIDYVRRDLQHPDGGFYSAEDADSEGKEGTFYLWTLSEFKQLLKTDLAELAIHHFGVTLNGNFFDPHTRETGQNVLTAAHDVDEKMTQALKEISSILITARNKRPRPHRDDKILTEWNGLMISALAIAGARLENSDYVLAAEKAASFLQTHLYDESEKRLYRRWRDGDRKINGQQSDYAMLVAGLLDLFEVTGKAKWLAWAIELEETQDQLFLDRDAGGYFMNSARADLLIRMKDEGDNVIPAGNSVAALNGLRLAKLLGREDFYKAARGTISLYAASLKQYPMGLSMMARALDLESAPPRQMVILGPTGRPDTVSLLKAARSSAASSGTDAVVIPVEPGLPQQELNRLLPFIGAMNLKDGRATLFVCENYACQAPTNDPEDLKVKIGQL